MLTSATSLSSFKKEIEREREREREKEGRGEGKRQRANKRDEGQEPQF